MKKTQKTIMINKRWSSLMMFLMFLISSSSEAKPQYTAMFVFGDSLIDPGNNIYFISSRAKAKYLPYGIDFPLGPTGRFSNGKIFTDFLGELLGLPLTPSYVDTVVQHASASSGVNYASAGCGILETTGLAYGRVIPLRKQIENFKNTLKQLENQMQEEELSDYLAKALVVDELGVNDYIEYYLLPVPSKIYTPPQFADFLIHLYTQRILEQHELGLRKFMLVEIPPIGCLPALKSTQPPSPGKCVTAVNDLVQTFNARLKSLVIRLNSDHPGSVFILAGAYRPYYQLHDNAESYGFKEKDSSCCKIQLNVSLLVRCAEFSVPCSNRDEFLFWDSAHPTDAVIGILVREIFGNESNTFPMSLQEMAKM